MAFLATFLQCLVLGIVIIANSQVKTKAKIWIMYSIDILKYLTHVSNFIGKKWKHIEKLKNDYLLIQFFHTSEIVNHTNQMISIHSPIRSTQCHPLRPARVIAFRQTTQRRLPAERSATLSHKITIVHYHQSDTLQHQYFQACTLTVLESCKTTCATTHAADAAEKKTCEEVCHLVTLVFLFINTR